MLGFIQDIRNLGINHAKSLLERRTIRLMNDLLIVLFAVQSTIYLLLYIEFRDVRTLWFYIFFVGIIGLGLFLNNIGKSYVVRIWFCWIMPVITLYLETVIPNPPSYALILLLLLVLGLVLNQSKSIRYIHLIYFFILFGIYSFFIQDQIETTLTPELLESREKVRYIILVVLILLLIYRFGSVSYTIEQKLQMNLDQIKNDNLALEQYQKQIEIQNEELVKVNKELEKFAYVASHDLKSPIRNINGFLTLIKRKLKDYDDQDVHEYLKYATDGASQMYKLVEDILAFSRITQKTEEYTTVDFNEVVKTSMTRLDAFIQEKNGKVEFQNLPVFTAHQEQVTTLFTALIKNGLLYNSNPTPTVEIKSQKTISHYEFSIKDNGIGIEEEHFDLIFSMFKRLHTQVEYQGTGVDLAICRKIAKFHNGSITVQSEVNKGSEFIVQLAI